jgi:cbb3-type cytochrome oxidase maturation protein
MSVFFIIMGVSVVLGGGFLAFFIWAVKSGQFDDTGTPPLRMLGDDEPGRAGGVAETKKQKRTP